MKDNMMKVTDLLSQRRFERNDAIFILHELSYCIKTRQNAAKATQYRFAASRVRDPIDLASDNRRFDREVFERWESGDLTMPEFDWEANKEPLLYEEGTPGEKRIETRTQAMARAWQVGSADPENYMWLCQHMPTFVRLVHSIECIIKAERHLHGGLVSMSPRDYAELETLNYALKACNRVLNPSPSDPRQVIRDAYRDRSIVNRRIRELRLKRLKSH